MTTNETLLVALLLRRLGGEVTVTSSELKDISLDCWMSTNHLPDGSVRYSLHEPQPVLPRG